MTGSVGEAAPWWRDAVIYQIYIRSFADGNGDGVGDIAGLRSRLPYLNRLGVDAIWITPWYPSPMADGGYDVLIPTDHANGLSDRSAYDIFVDSHGVRTGVTWYDAAVHSIELFRSAPPAASDFL